MHEHDDADFDDLPELLQPAAIDDTTDLRRRLFDQTRSVLRRRRRVRTAGFCAALAACYLAGLVTAGLAFRTQSPLLSAHVPVRNDGVGVLTPTAETAVVAESSTRVPDVPASVLERLATLMPHDEYRNLLRRAGDRHIAETGDLAAALRCYSRSLDASRAEQLEISGEDNWLVMALKDARQKELQNGNSGG